MKLSDLIAVNIMWLEQKGNYKEMLLTWKELPTGLKVLLYINMFTSQK